MANEYVNKVVLSSGETLIDLSGDTVDAAHVLKERPFAVMIDWRTSFSALLRPVISLLRQ